MSSLIHCRLPSVFACALLLMTALSARGDEVWTITTADFLERRGVVMSIDADGVRYRESSGAPSTLPWSQVLELSRGSERPNIGDDQLALRLTGGDCLIGSPSSLVDETLTWTTSLGEFAAPLRRCRSITRGEAPALDESPQRDTLQLVNGDVLEGVVESIAPEGLTINTGSPADVAWDLVAALHFAGVNGDPPAAERSFRIATSGGSILRAQQVQLSGQQLEIRTADAATRALPISTVAAIEQFGGPVAWLVDLPPIEKLHQPYFSTDPAPIRFITAAGEIRDGDRPARNGITVQSYSRIVWKLDGQHKAFRARFAIDGQLPYANAVVRVKLDDRIVYEAPDVTSATPTQRVIVPLGAAKQLSLEVDYGKTYDVQDRVNWIEPALLREIPATQPAR